MFENEDRGRDVRICRPAFQDFHRLLPRYQARSELNRQLQKLRWWNLETLLVIDLPWSWIPGTNLAELVIDPCGDIGTGVRVVFFEHLTSDARSIWILGGVRFAESFGEVHRAVYLGRSTIVQQRATV